MNTPEWIKPAAYGFGAGAITLSVLGFTAFGWVSSSTAETQANASSRAAVLAALTPVCLERARTDPNSSTILAQINEARAPQRRTLLMETGWATMPGETAPNRDLAEACHRALSTT